MALLILGVLLWAVSHLFPAVGVDQRARLVQRLGEGRYRGLFSLVIALAVVLMVLGWKSAAPMPVYRAPSLGPPLTGMVMLVAMVLFFSARPKTNIKRALRHPQLTGVLVWALAHLLANGDSRSVVLFGGLAVWTIVQIIATNRRDGPWKKPDAVSLKMDAIPLVIGVVAYGVLLWAHPWLFGVPAATL
jgi:uncharacterized membrane protein